MKCFFGHKWGKFGSVGSAKRIKEDVVNGYTSEVEVYVQARECERCGKVQIKEVQQ